MAERFGLDHVEVRTAIGYVFAFGVTAGGALPLPGATPSPSWLGRSMTHSRWDRVHLREVELADGMRLTTPYEEWDSVGPVADDRRTELSRLKPCEQLAYGFDFGDG